MYFYQFSRAGVNSNNCYGKPCLHDHIGFTYLSVFVIISFGQLMQVTAEGNLRQQFMDGIGRTAGAVFSERKRRTGGKNEKTSFSNYGSRNGEQIWGLEAD